MVEALERTFLHFAALALVVLAAGCASPRAITSGNAEGKPAAAGSRAEMAGFAEVEVERLIVPQGPESWTAQAGWDEYGLVLRNPGSMSVVVTALELVGDPGGSTWHTTWADSLRRDSMARGSAADRSARVLVATTALVGGLSCHLMILPPAIPLCLVSAAVASSVGLKMKEDQASIDVRGLRVPMSLAPGEDIRGSAFFAITPRAERLRVHLNIEGEDHVVELFLRSVASGTAGA